MGERCNRTAEASGSIPLSSTTAPEAIEMAANICKHTAFYRRLLHMYQEQTMCTYLAQVSHTY